VFSLLTVALTDIAEIIDNASFQPVIDVFDELLQSAVKEFENQHVFEADHI
jgi:hypothetical protein